jgi:transposase-like protein
MKAMARHRSHSIEFKRQAAQEFIAGETLHGLAARHGVSCNLIRVWVMKFEAGAFDEDAEAADLLQEYEAKIAALDAWWAGRRSKSKPNPVRPQGRTPKHSQSRLWNAGGPAGLAALEARIPSRRGLPPVIWRGVNPSHAAMSRPRRKALALPTGRPGLWR